MKEIKLQNFDHSGTARSYTLKKWRLLSMVEACQSGNSLFFENEHNDRRLHQQAGYSLADHLDVLIALIGEARLLTQARQLR